MMKEFLEHWRARLQARRAKVPRAAGSPTRPGEQASAKWPVLVIVEGSHDIEFLRRISMTLHAGEPLVPNLATMELNGELIFVPLGGGDLCSWAMRFAGLGRSEFHLYDREIPPETTSRKLAIDIVNQRTGCRAVLTSKRSLENYLHPAAIREVLGIEVSFSDQDQVAELVAAGLFAMEERQIAWHELPPKSRRRHREKVKKRLNREVVSRMTAERLLERDPNNEVRSWLAEIANLVQGG